MLLAQIAVFSATGGYLVMGARGDARAATLGVSFLVIATSFALRPIQIAEAWAGGSSALHLLSRLQVDAFLPALAWAFFLQFPRSLSSTAARERERAVVQVLVLLGVGLLLANIAIAVSDNAGEMLHRLDAHAPTSLFWILAYGLVLPAFPFAVWRARSSRREEQRRVALFLLVLALGGTPVALFILAFAASPRFASWARSPEVHPIVMSIVQSLILSVPVMTAYSVLIDRVLDVRIVVRKALQYGVARGGVAALSASPFLWLSFRLYGRRGETLEHLAEGYEGAALAGLLFAGVAALRARRPLAAFIDGFFFREQYDTRRILLDVAERTRAASSGKELAELWTTEIERALHLERIGVLVLDSLSGELRDPAHRLRSLDSHSELAFFLATVPSPVVVDLEQSDSGLAHLPPDDRQWLADAGIALLVPLVSSAQQLIGAIALGQKRSELPFTREDRMLLVAIGSSGATALENRILRDASERLASAGVPRAEPWDARGAKECRECLGLEPPDAVVCARCGGSTDSIALPFLLLGKFRLDKRIGTGSMGVVYRAVDLSLKRAVAVKTLPRTSPEDSARLRREARAMAAILHPNLALIYGAESWLGTPLLVLELLEGGTLAATIEQGRLPIERVVELGASLCDAIAAVHAAGVLHRDVKPSNIAFTRDGVAKLLDFGLARFEAGGGLAPAHALLESALHTTGRETRTGLVGTPLYMSPEALSGGAADPGFDLWALAIVLYESIAGRNPLQRETWAATLEAIEGARVPDLRELEPACPEAVARQFSVWLSRDHRRRPQSAREMKHQLTALRELC